MKVDFAACIRARLLNRAKERGEDFSLVLNRYAVERYLYRLSLTPWRERFLLKGALLFDFWFDQPHRPTRDADFLGFGPEDARALESAVCEICQVNPEGEMDVDTVAKAIAATTSRRGTPLPGELPVGLSDEFATDPGKLKQWKAFLGKSRLEAPELQETIADIRDYLREPMRVARAERHLS